MLELNSPFEKSDELSGHDFSHAASDVK
jgi:hypothetical protein